MSVPHELFAYSHTTEPLKERNATLDADHTAIYMNLKPTSHCAVQIEKDDAYLVETDRAERGLDDVGHRPTCHHCDQSNQTRTRRGSANQRASRRPGGQPDLSAPRAAVSGGEEDGLAGYRSECGRPDRTGARRGCRRSGLRLPWRWRQGGRGRVDCVGGWLHE
jgi:hypothetical protein